MGNFKNKILLQFAFTGIMFSANILDAQKISMLCEDKEVYASKDTCALIIVFKGRYCEGKNYLRWSVKDQQRDGLYIIYRSVDGRCFEVLGQIKGDGVPISIPIGYYFKDEKPHAGTNYYMLVHRTKEKTFLMSEIISIECSHFLFSNSE